MYTPGKPVAVLCCVLVIAIVNSAWADDTTTLAPLDHLAQAYKDIATIQQSPDYNADGDKVIEARIIDIASDLTNLIKGLDKLNGGIREGDIDIVQSAKDILQAVKDLPTDPIGSLDTINKIVKKTNEEAPGIIEGSLFFIPPDAERSLAYDDATLDQLVATIQYAYNHDPQYKDAAVVQYRQNINLIRDIPKVFDRLIEELKKLTTEQAQSYGQKLQDPLAEIFAIVVEPHIGLYQLPTNGKSEENGLTKDSFPPKPAQPQEDDKKKHHKKHHKHHG